MKFLTLHSNNKLSFHKTGILFVILFLIFSFRGYSQTTEFKLAADIWPPFTDIETEKSIATDLVDEALNRIDINTSVELLKFEEVLSSINSGDYDGSPALWINEERKKNLVFSKPYLHNQLIVVGRKGDDVNAATINDFKGKKIGVVENYAYDIKTDDVIFVSGESDQQNLSRLLSNQIDYMLVDAILIQYLLKYQLNDVSEFLEIGSNALLVKSLHFAIGKDVVGAEEIISKFNIEITNMISDGTYNKILELNWIHADIDGDGKTELILHGDEAGSEAPVQAYGFHAQSLTNDSNSMNRYYIDGKIYSGWDNVPQQYKTDIVMESQSLENSGIRLNFK